jgi:hypothetical protein
VIPAGFDCSRAEELLSDHLEGILDPLLARELDAHLRTCADCRALREALTEVVEALRSFPTVEPSAGLAARVARAAIVNAQRRRAAAFAPRLPAWLQAVAAGLSILTTVGLLVAQGGTARAAGGRLVERTASAGTYVLEKKDRLLEDFRILRVVVAAAIEGRLDRASDRVEDYRRLLERRREAEQQRLPASPAPTPQPSPVKPSTLSNSPRDRRVEQGVERSNQ